MPQLAFGARRGQVIDRLTLKNSIDGGDGLHAKLRSDGAVFIDVDLGELHPGGEFCGDRRATSELQSLMCISYAVFCLKKKKTLRASYSYVTAITQKLHASTLAPQDDSNLTQHHN